MEIGIVFLESVNKINNAITSISKRLAKRPVYGLRYISFEDDFPFDICNEFKKKGLTPIIMEPVEIEKILRHLIKTGRPPPNFDISSLN